MRSSFIKPKVNLSSTIGQPRYSLESVEKIGWTLFVSWLNPSNTGTDSSSPC